MIDTIVLRFHGVLEEKNDPLSDVRETTKYAVDEHHELYKKMLRYENKFVNMVQRVNKEITTITAETDSEFLQRENGKGKNGFRYVKQVMRFADEGKIKETIGATNGKWRSPSSIAAVVFKINHNAGYIDFNLSIPKYLYGHSLAEFVPQVKSKAFFDHGFDLDTIKNQRKIIYKRLMKFIDKFLLDICKMFKLETLPNKDYIEIRRLDLCYNQYFETREDALNYLSHQKKKAKKKATQANNRLDTHDTSLEYFTTSGGYFKIYHKGTEYINSKFGDYKKHAEYNKNFIEYYIKSNDFVNSIKPDLSNRDFVLKLFEDKLKGNPIYIDENLKEGVNRSAKILKKIQPFKTDFLKEEMDKVLRYEISLSGDFFSYQYKVHVFRNTPFKLRKGSKFVKYDFCPNYKELKENYKFVHSVYHSPTKQDVTIKKFENRDYKKLHEFYNRKICLTLSEKQSSKWILKSSSYTYDKIKSSHDLSMIPYKHTLLSTKDVGIFCNDFLQRCFDYFFRTIDSFKINKLENYDTISSKINEHNEKVKERVELYNEINHFLTKDIKGNFIIKGNRIITKATQLLTQTQKRDLKLKRIEPLRLLQVLREMERGVSLHQIRDDLKLEKSTYSRLKSDLAMFGVFEETLQMEKPIFTEINYRQYYHNTRGIVYQSKFYHKETHMQYG